METEGDREGKALELLPEETLEHLLLPLPALLPQAQPFRRLIYQDCTYLQ